MSSELASIDYMTDKPKVQAEKAQAWARALPLADLVYFVERASRDTFALTKPLRQAVLHEAARRLVAYEQARNAITSVDYPRRMTQ